MKKKEKKTEYELLSAETILKSIKTGEESDTVLSNIVLNLVKLKKSLPEKEYENLINSTSVRIKDELGIHKALHFIYRLELANKTRKPTLAIYDHAFHFIGGAQKYGLTMVKALEDLFDITIISNRNVTHENFMNWYGLDLSKMNIKIIPIPYFEDLGTFHIEPHRVTKNMDNPFHIIGKESGLYDIFINNGMLEMVYPLSPYSVMICHFPERRPQSYFYSDLYTYTIYNSNYTGEWIRKRWKYEPHERIYPPVDMSPDKIPQKKEKIILSVARFEEGGTKKQFEMVKSFKRLKEIYPDESKDWKLILIGGSTGKNRYLDKIEMFVNDNPQYSIELMVNIGDNELRELYKRSMIFWHLCGIGQNDPAKVEHFGMTIAEAMQNGIIPIVYDGGGQKEIVESGISGFRIRSLNGLIKRTVYLMTNSIKAEKMKNSALIKSKQYDVIRFNSEIKKFFTDILRQIV